MSPLLQKRRPPQSPDPPTSLNQLNLSRSPQTWFRPANSRSLTSLPKSQHPHRAFGFSSIKGLARSSSRQTLRTLPNNTYQPPYSHGCSPPKVGELRQPNADKPRKPSTLSDPGLQQSRDSSVESLPVDKSGISSNSTYATTPSSAKHRAFELIESSSPVQRKGMGNKPSMVRSKSVPTEGEQSSAAETIDMEKGHESPDQQASDSSQKLTTFSTRGSGIIVNVPRRRSSLTVLHLDSSHFGTPDPQHQNLQHRASTLTEPHRRPSVLAETRRPVTTIVASSSDTTPTMQVQQRETLSPAFLSPPLLSPTSRLSSASSQAPSSKSQTSTGPAFIHLPKTVPDGPIPVPAPPLTVTHYKCYQAHRRVTFSRNKIHPVPCMTCGTAEGETRWKCIWCALRVCAACMAEFDGKNRNLEKFMAGREKGKMVEPKESGGKDEVPELDGGKEANEIKKENTAGLRESQKFGTAKTKKLSSAPK